MHAQGLFARPAYKSDKLTSENLTERVLMHDKHSMHHGQHEAVRSPAGIGGRPIWTCPMHPQIDQDKPGACPICGMALEPKGVPGTAGEENAELRVMTRRFWIGCAMTLPVFLIGMSRMIPSLAG